MTNPVWLSIQQAVDLFGVSRSTIDRSIRKGAIHQSQTRRHGSERQIAFAELIRAFGEPKNRPAEAGKPPIATTTAAPETAGDDTRRLVEQLETALERERQRADKEAARADQERARAERYEDELTRTRVEYSALVQRLLPPPAEARPTGFWSRLFGR